MIAKAEGKFLRISPSKAGQVITLLRRKSVVEAQSILRFLNKRAKEYVSKILKSAVANAKVKGFSENQLYISKIVANPGPTWKRFKAAAFGRASPIEKRTSHIRIELDMETKGPEQKAESKKKQKVKAGIKELK
ncbi:MAG: 50S ribosomal protein L22 [Candidatus Omnitrophica bacterium]|nr:50S ribosomal protein L22 [Candidatus Omnitrophota bacterium]